MRQHGVAAPQGRHQRAADLGLDLRGLEGGEGPHPDRAADIVDQDVDAAEQAGRLGHRRDRAVVAFEVAAKGLGAVARLDRDVADEIRPVDQQHPSALRRRAQRDRPADALRRAGDDQDLVREASREDHAGTGSLAANFS